AKGRAFQRNQLLVGPDFPDLPELLAGNLPFDGQAVLVWAGKQHEPRVLLPRVDLALEVLRQATLHLAPRRRPALPFDLPDEDAVPPGPPDLFADDLVPEELGVADQKLKLVCAADEIVEPCERGPEFRGAVDRRQVALPAQRA